MWNKHKYSILSFLLIVGIFLTGVRLPYFVEAAGATNPAPATAITNEVKKFLQDGSEIVTGNKIDLYKDITATIKFDGNLNQDDPNHISKNNYVEYDLGEYFKFSENASSFKIVKPVYDKNNISRKICDAIFTRDGDSKVKVRFDFSTGADSVFNERNLTIEAQVKLKVDISKIDPSNLSTQKITILGAKYDIGEPKEELEVKKSGKISWQDATVEWTVHVERKMQGADDKYLSLVDYKFEDVLNGTGEYVNSSFAINGNLKTRDSDSSNRKILYTVKGSDFTTPNKGKVDITFKTKITGEDLKEGKKYTNKATIMKDSSKKSSNEAVVEVKKFGKKTGSYDSKTGNITWYIEFNEEEADLGNVTITDRLLKDDTQDSITQTLKNSTYQEWDSLTATWGAVKSIVPSSNDYTISNVNKKIRLIIVTKPEITDNMHYLFKNYANIKWGTVLDVYLDGKTDVNDNIIKKDAASYGFDLGEQAEDEDKLSWENDKLRRIGFETEWTAEFKKIPNYNANDYYMYDVFIFDNDIISSRDVVNENHGYKITDIGSTNLASLPVSVTLEKIGPKHNRHQRLILNAYGDKAYQVVTGSAGVNVYAIRNSTDKVVGHLMQISNLGKSDTKIKFKSKLIEPAQLLNKQGEGFNYLTLVKDGNIIDYVDSWPRYTSKMIKKQALSKEAAKQFLVSVDADATNKDIFDNENKKPKDNVTKSYNREDKSVVYRISVNAADIKDTDGDLGKITVKDELPEDWEFTTIKDDKKFLIYKGTPATSKAKADATVLAEGNALTDSELSGKVSSTFTTSSTKDMVECAFTKIDSPYVIFLKAKLKEADDVRKKYLNYYNDITNYVSLTTTKKTKNANGTDKEFATSSEQKVKVDERFLWKNIDKEKTFEEWQKEGFVKWEVIYRPYKPYTDSEAGTKVILKDKSNNNLLIRREKGNANLIFEGDNYRIFEGTVDDEGNFTKTKEISENLNTIFKYDTAQKEFIIELPDKTKSYKISYITDFKADILSGATIENTISMFENSTKMTIQEPKVSREVSVAASGMVRGFEKLKVVKRSSTNNNVLKGAEFELKKNGNIVGGSPKTTGEDGIVDFGRLTPGDYTLKETKAPNGYTSNGAEYRIKITELEVGMRVELIGSYPNTKKEGNELTITNEPIPSNPGGGGGVTPPPTTPETPVTPVVPPKPENPVKPVEPPKPNDPEKPNDPGKPNKPTKPTTPEEPEDPDPEEPDEPEEPDTPDPTPNIPSYPFNNTPDPNDPNSPDEITVIGDDGTPLGRFIKKQKPDGTFEYVDADDGTPLGNIKAHRLPKTGGTGNTWYYAIGAGLILGAGLTFKKRKEEGQED